MVGDLIFWIWVCSVLADKHLDCPCIWRIFPMFCQYASRQEIWRHYYPVFESVKSNQSLDLIIVLTSWLYEFMLTKYKIWIGINCLWLQIFKKKQSSSLLFCNIYSLSTNCWFLRAWLCFKEWLDPSDYILKTKEKFQE